MAIQQFDSYALYLVLNDSPDPAASISATENAQLSQVIVVLYKHGAHAATARIRASLYADVDCTKKIATGDWFNINDITGISTYWLGRIGLTFPTQPWLKSGSTYYIGIESENYTRDAETHYLAFRLAGGPSPSLDAFFVVKKSESVE